MGSMSREEWLLERRATREESQLDFFQRLDFNISDGTSNFLDPTILSRLEDSVRRQMTSGPLNDGINTLVKKIREAKPQLVLASVSQEAIAPVV